MENKEAKQYHVGLFRSFALLHCSYYPHIKLVYLTTWLY